MQPTRTYSSRRCESGRFSPDRQGFTLVEMLVVISIIGILAALLIPTIGGVMSRTRLRTIEIEVNNLVSAVESYKLDHGDYPPDFSNVDAVVSHVRKAFPRNTFPIRQWLTGQFYVPDFDQDGNPGPNPLTLDPAEALVFWMSRLKNVPRNPFTGNGEYDIHFEFKADQLVDNDDDGWFEYASEHAEAAPYVYFDGRVVNDQDVNQADLTCLPTGNPAVCAYAWSVYPAPTFDAKLVCVGRNIPIPVVDASQSQFGVVRPYRSNTNIPATDNSTVPTPVTDVPGFNSTTWVDAGKFQIIAPGLDRSFGIDHGDTTNGIIFKSFPAQNYYNVSPGDPTEDRDNVTSFSEGTIGGAVP